MARLDVMALLFVLPSAAMISNHARGRIRKTLHLFQRRGAAGFACRCRDPFGDAQSASLLLSRREQFSSSTSVNTYRNTHTTSHISLEIERTFREHVLSQFSGSRHATAFMVLCVSGGCDSMALLHATNELLESDASASLSSSQVLVAHFDHQLRGDESDSDRKLVEDTCRDLGIACRTYEWSESGMGNRSFSQAAARNWRRKETTKLLRERMAEGSLGVIVTAHHRADSAESLLLKLVRGAHITNLRGMDVWKPINEESRIGYFRPFLGVTKEQLASYLIERGKTWREDASNASPKYLRNRVRNELVPLLQDLMTSTKGDGSEGTEESSSNVLLQRLEALSEQSRQTAAVIEPLIANRFQNLVSKDGKYFLLKDYSDDDSADFSGQYIQSQALHRWCTSRMKQIISDRGMDMASTPSLPNHQLKRIQSQLLEHSDSERWTLEVGSNWNVVRKGSALVIEYDGRQKGNLVELTWKSHDDGSATVVPICLPEDERGSCKFVLTTAGEWPASLSFVPSWRRGRSPTKIRQFLRGQDVPEYERDDSLAIICRKNDEPSLDRLAAIRVGNEWLVHAYFDLSNGCQNDRIYVQICKK